MRSIFTLLLFSLLVFQAKAQWVDLPDYSELKGECIRYDNTRSVYQIDVSCANNVKKIDLKIGKYKGTYTDSNILNFLNYYANIDTLEFDFVDYLTGIHLYCDFSSVNKNIKGITIHAGGFLIEGSHIDAWLTISNLPDAVESIDIHTTAFSTYNIDKWPSSIKSLFIHESDDSMEKFTLNGGLPKNLEELILYTYVDIPSIVLPETLKRLVLYAKNFDYNRLADIELLEKVVVYSDNGIPNKEFILNLNNEMLKSLELVSANLNPDSSLIPNLIIQKLPNSIEHLRLVNFQLNIEYVPISLKGLGIYSINNISSIVDKLPDHIESLELAGAVTNSIEKFPEQLKKLNLEGMKLNSLPDFPEGLDSLLMNNIEGLKCIPLFPDNLKYFDGWNLGRVKCIPNETRYVKATAEWPVCTDNEFICNADEFTIVNGTVYYDLNKNGVKDAGDIPAYGEVLSLNEESFATSNKDGIYKLILREYGTFEIKAVTNHPHILATLPAVKTIEYDENYVSDSIHFLIQLEDVKDLKITGTNLVARPGMQTLVTAFAENLGVNDLSDVTVKIKKPQDWSVENAVPTGYRTDNDTIIWENVSLSKLSQSSFKVQTQLPATATILGNPYQYEMWVENPDDVTPENNYYRITDTIRGSYDPNDKIVNHTSLTPENSNAQELVYTIRFQNTGTDTAFKVIVVDTIIGNLDPSSIRVLGASHDFTWEYSGQGIAAFTFDNILLPDSNVNEPASHGFVTLAVRANKDLAVGDSIYNRAGIYFDFNEPVITNKALTRIATVTSVYTHANTSLKIYPNPAKDRVRVEWNAKERATLTLLDISGKVIRTQTLNQNFSDIDVSKLSKGMYLIQVQSTEGTSVGKLLIQ